MATEACDCGGTCSACRSPFTPSGIRIQITLEGYKNKGSRWNEYLWNEAVSHFYIPGEELIKADQRRVVAKIAEALKLKPSHSV